MVFPLPRKSMDWDNALRLHEREGWTFARIAREFEYSPMTVRQTLTKMGARGRLKPAVAASERSRRLYLIWTRMRQQCRNPNHPSHHLYGGRGVSVCEEWEEFDSFKSWAGWSGYRGGDSLVLIDWERDFSPGNCRWRSRREKRPARLLLPRNAMVVTAFGEERSLTAWAGDPRCRVSRATLAGRLRRGIPAERALSAAPLAEDTLPHGRRKRSRRPRRSSRDLMVRLHTQDGLSCAEIARRLGLSYPGVYEALRARGVFRSTWTGVRSDPESRRLYPTWIRIRMSCTNPRSRDWPSIGRKGIGYVKAWDRFEAFLDWARRSGAAPGLCLARIDRAKDFGPANCTWISRRDSTLRARHRGGEKRQRVMITAFGETKGLSSWSRDKRCSPTLWGLLWRLREGWDPEYALTAPPQSAGRGKGIDLRAFGEVKSYSAWIRDPRCKLLSPDALRARLARGMAPEDAIRRPPYSATAGVPGGRSPLKRTAR